VSIEARRGDVGWVDLPGPLELFADRALAAGLIAQEPVSQERSSGSSRLSASHSVTGEPDAAAGLVLLAQECGLHVESVNRFYADVRVGAGAGGGLRLSCRRLSGSLVHAGVASVLLDWDAAIRSGAPLTREVFGLPAHGRGGNVLPREALDAASTVSQVLACLDRSSGVEGLVAGLRVAYAAASEHDLPLPDGAGLPALWRSPDLKPFAMLLAASAFKVLSDAPFGSAPVFGPEAELLGALLADVGSREPIAVFADSGRFTQVCLGALLHVGLVSVVRAEAALERVPRRVAVPGSPVVMAPSAGSAGVAPGGL
jgi:hypothetical protein